MSKQIETAIAAENWPRARTLIRSALKKTPDSHWLVTRLGLTYYEQRQYKRSLRYAQKALLLAPSCPLVLWDYAGCLDMLDRSKEALGVYRRIVGRGVDRLADGDCGEGKAWARGMVADCYYRMAHCHRDLGRKKLAAVAYRRHLAFRVPGSRSIHARGIVKKELQSLYEEIAQQAAAGTAQRRS